MSMCAAAAAHSGRFNGWLKCYFLFSGSFSFETCEHNLEQHAKEAT